MATSLASKEQLCPFHTAHAGIGPDEELVFPRSKSAILQHVNGAPEITLFHGDKEISFETPGQIGFAIQLVKQGRFRAGDAIGWSALPWDEIAPMLDRLVGAGVLVRARDFDGALAIGREEWPSPLPPAVAEQPHDWREPGLLAALTGRDLELGYLEAVVPIFRVAHPWLDRDGRQVGEGNVFPKALRLDVPTQWRTCTYNGSRYQPAKPMNVTALKAMREHWPQMMALLAPVRAAYLRRFPDAEGGWTVGHVERLSTMVLALPSYLLLRERDQVANGCLHPALSSLFRVTDGLRMAVHQMMFVPIAEAMLAPETPASAAAILAYAERNYSFHSDHGVCAGPQSMVEEFLAVLVDGAAPKAGWPERLDPEVEEAIALIGPALDYGLLGLQTHGAAFSLWPAMARAYERIGAALDAGGASDSEAGRAFAAHRRRMVESSYLGAEAWRRRREASYAEMHGASAAGLFGRWTSEEFGESVAAAPLTGSGADALEAAVTRRVGAAAAPGVAEAILAFIARGQAILRAVETSQSAINVLLGRPLPQRPLSLADLDIHNKLITGQTRSLPFLLDELHRLFGIAIDADAVRVRVSPGSGHRFDGISPIEARRASRAPFQGE